MIFFFHHVNSLDQIQGSNFHFKSISIALKYTQQRSTTTEQSTEHKKNKINYIGWHTLVEFTSHDGTKSTEIRKLKI